MRGFSLNLIKDALGELVKNGEPWPPTAPEFRAICLGENQENELAEHVNIRKAEEQYKISHEKRMRHGTQAERNEKARPWIDQIKRRLKTKAN